MSCSACQEFFHLECLSLSPEDQEKVLADPDWKCRECRALQGPPGPPGPLITPATKNKVAPVKQYPRIIKYQKVEERGEGRKCTTCKILVEEVKRREETIQKLREKIELMESEAALKVDGEAEVDSRQL